MCADVAVVLTAHRLADLLGHVSDLVQGVRQEAVGLEEVEGAEGEQLKGDANVTVEVKAVEHLDAVADEKATMTFINGVICKKK